MSQECRNVPGMNKPRPDTPRPDIPRPNTPRPNTPRPVFTRPVLGLDTLGLDTLGLTHSWPGTAQAMNVSGTRSCRMSLIPKPGLAWRVLKVSFWHSGVVYTGGTAVTLGTVHG